MLSDRSHKNIINADIEQCRKNNQIINSGKGCSVLPLVDGLRRMFGLGGNRQLGAS